MHRLYCEANGLVTIIVLVAVVAAATAIAVGAGVLADNMLYELGIKSDIPGVAAETIVPIGVLGTFAIAGARLIGRK